MSPKGSVEVDVKRQAKVRKGPKPAESKGLKYHFWDRPKVTRDPRVTRRLQQGDVSVPTPTFHPPKPARDNFDPPPAYYPPEPARPSHGLSDESRHNDKGLRRAQTTHRQQRYEGIPNYSQRETEGVNYGHSDQGRSQRGSERDSQRGDQHGSQRSSQRESRRQ